VSEVPDVAHPHRREHRRDAWEDFVWPTIFPNAASTTVLIDRLAHHSEISSIEGASDSKRAAASAKDATATRRRRKTP
jgi:hypothetical protein